MDAQLTALSAAAFPLEDRPQDLAPLIQLIGDARFVLLGEATHGTDEFYRQRIRLTRQLIEEQNFDALALEADWPAALRVQRYVQGHPQDRDAEHALGDFLRFPSWMWRNAPMRDFIEWLRDYNLTSRAASGQVGVYGLDLYSLHASMRQVIDYLDRVDPDAAARARNRYDCFESFGGDAGEYGYSAGLDLSEGCEREVISQLTELQRGALHYATHPHGERAAEAFFEAQRNAVLVKNAEAYYRAMFRDRVSAWNGATATWRTRCSRWHSTSGRRGAASHASSSGPTTRTWAMRVRQRWPSAARSTSDSSFARRSRARR